MTKAGNLFPVCSEGHLKEFVGKNAVEYKGRITEPDMLYSVCDVCASEQSASAQLRANKRAMVAFKKQVDGLISGEEMRAFDN